MSRCLSSESMASVDWRPCGRFMGCLEALAIGLTGRATVLVLRGLNLIDLLFVVLAIASFPSDGFGDGCVVGKGATVDGRGALVLRAFAHAVGLRNCADGPRGQRRKRDRAKRRNALGRLYPPYH